MGSKSYFRLNELQYHYDITVDELRYFVEQKKLLCSFLLPSSKLVFGSTNKLGFTACGFGEFKGLISVSNSASLELFQKERTRPRLVIIRDGEFSHYSTEYPYSVSVPNSVIQDWQPSSLSKAKPNILLAKMRPYEASSGTALLSEVTEVLKSFSQADKEVDNPWAQRLNDKNIKKLYSEGFTFNLADTCFYIKDLKSLGLLKSDRDVAMVRKNQKHLERSGLPDSSVSASNEISSYYNRGSKTNRIVSNLVDYAPTSKSSELWTLLRRSLNDDELLDQLDPDREILDMTPNEIIWNVPEEAPSHQKQIKRSTFNNVLAKIKKKS